LTPFRKNVIRSEDSKQSSGGIEEEEKALKQADYKKLPVRGKKNARIGPPPRRQAMPLTAKLQDEKLQQQKIGTKGGEEKDLYL